MSSTGMSPYQAPDMPSDSPLPNDGKKSSIPKVMGILHIIFGVIGLIMAVKAFSAGSQSEQLMASLETQGLEVPALSQELQDALATIDAYAGISSVLGLLGAVALLVAGVGLVKYLKWGRLFSNIYVVISAIGKGLTVFLYLGPMSVFFDVIVESSTEGQEISPVTMKGIIIGAMLVGVLISSAYLIVTLILVNKKTARESLC